MGLFVPGSSSSSSRQELAAVGSSRQQPAGAGSRMRVILACFKCMPSSTVLADK